MVVSVESSRWLDAQVQLVVLVSAFVMVSTVWSVSCLQFFYSRCPHAQPFVSGGHVPPVPYGAGAYEWSDQSRTWALLKCEQQLGLLLKRPQNHHCCWCVLSGTNYHNKEHDEWHLLWCSTPFDMSWRSPIYRHSYANSLQTYLYTNDLFTVLIINWTWTR